MSIEPNSCCGTCGGSGECFGRTCDCVTDQIRSAARRGQEDVLRKQAAKLQRLERQVDILTKDVNYLKGQIRRTR